MKSKAKLTRLCSILLVLVMLVGLLPTTALAAEATATADFDADPVSALALLNAAKTGTVDSTWDSGTKTLTLNGVNFETSAAIAVILPADSKIVLAEGTTNTITGGNSASGDCYGIYPVGSLTIQGPGTLNVTSGTSTDSIGSSYGITAYDLIIKGTGTLTVTGGTATCGSRGIWADRHVTIESGTVKATGGTATNDNSYGIGAQYGNVTISGDNTTVTANGGEAVWNSCGIYAHKNVTISDGAEVIANGGTASGDNGLSCGIYAHCNGDDDIGVTISGGTVKATGGAVEGTDGASCGIYAASGNVAISDDADVTATGGEATNGSSYGIYAIVRATISDGTVTAIGGTATNGSSYGIYAHYGATISDGTVTAIGGTTDNESYGMHLAYGTTRISGGTVTAQGGTAGQKSYGIYAIPDSYGQVFISSTANVTAIGGTATNGNSHKAYYFGSEGHTITFDGNGGTGISKMQAFTGSTGIDYTLPANVFTAPAGKQFKGWATSADGAVISGTTITVTADTTLYAIWKADLAGSVTIDGDAKFGAQLTANTTGITNNTGTLSYQWKRNDSDISGATGSTYTLVEEDIGNTITVTVTSSVESGEITSAATAAVEKADGPAAPSVTPVPCTNESNNDGKITGVTTAMEYSTASNFSSKTACTGTEIAGLTNGTYYVRVAETATHKAGAAATVNVPAYSAEPTYSIDLDVNSVYRFDAVTVGYAPIIAKTVTVRNTGSGATGALTVALSGSNASSFELNKASIADIAVSGSDTFTVVPKTGLSAGTYTATVTVSGGNSISASFNVSFTVNADARTYSIDLDVNSVYSFDTVTVGYAPIVAKTVTVRNTGTAATGALTVALSGRNANGFELNKTSIADIAVSGSDTFTIAPKTGLSAGTYTATVTVSGDNSISASFNVRFTVRSAGGSSGGSYTPPTYKVESTVSKDADGSVSFSKSNAKKGDAVTITVTPDRYYKVDGVTVKDKNGKEIAVTDNGDGTFTFQMPDSKVTVEPVFSWDNPFGDVSETAYYAPAVEWALKNDVTGGTTAATFSPDAGCTRAQIVTFLWRAVGCPEPAGANSFTDVSADAYYAKAVVWAAEQGITGGTGDGKFSPDAVCTRSQSMTFLYRTAGSPEVSDNASFSDVEPNAYYAAAVAWAEQNGVTGGIGGGLFGSANDCTRGQIVTFLYRFFVK